MSKEKSTADYAIERIGYLQERANETYAKHRRKRQQIAQETALSVGMMIVGAGFVLRGFPNIGLVGGGAGCYILGRTTRKHAQEVMPLTSELRTTVDQAVHLARVNDMSVPFRVGDYIVTIGNAPKIEDE